MRRLYSILAVCQPFSDDAPIHVTLGQCTSMKKGIQMVGQLLGQKELPFAVRIHEGTAYRSEYEPIQEIYLCIDGEDFVATKIQIVPTQLNVFQFSHLHPLEEGERLETLKGEWGTMKQARFAEKMLTVQPIEQPLISLPTPQKSRLN